MEYDYEHLESMFESNPLSAIEQSQAIICQVAHFDTYKEFYTYHLENAHISTCQSEWSTPELCIFCRECGLVNQACVCLSCFLNGNHDGHDYVVLSSVGGNCDCGDTEQWRRSGFCDKHRGLDDENSNPEDYLDEKLKTVLTDVIFRAAFTSLKKFTNDKNEESNAVIQFVASFLKFGDGFRRLVARSLTEKTDLKGLMLNIINYDTKFNRSLQQLCGGLVNDQLFIRNFSGICYEVLIESVLKDSTNIMFKGNENVSYAIWNDFWFHCYSEKILEYYINQKNWDWVKFFTESLSYFKELLLFVGTEGYNEIPQSLITIVYRVFAATQIQPNEETQRFFDQVFTVILADKCQSKLVEGKVIEMNVITSFKESTERLHFFSTFHFIIAFFELFNGFKNKPNLKFDVLFDMLKNTIDISPIFSIGNNFVGNSKNNENDKLVLSFLKNNENNKSYLPTNYKSFHNGGSFYILHPLFSSLMSLFMIDDISKEKISSFFSLEENQSLRIKLGIINLKTIVSYICHRQNIASAKNIGIDFLYSIFDKPNMVSNFFPNFIPIFQLLLGLKCSNKSMNEELCLKEFFAFELAREIGIFDDFTSNDYKDENVGEKQKQMIFSFLYLSLLFVIERNMFHFDGCKFIQEQIIFALKNGIHSIDKLNKLYDTSVFESWQNLWGFNDVLMKVATTTASSKNISNEHENDNEDDNESHESAKSFQKDVSFYLKDDAEWKPISAINSINGQMTLMNNQISKNPDQLLKIQEFEPEETFFFPPKQAANENDNDNEIKPSEFNIHLKQFLMTPTVLSIVYNTLRTSAGIDSASSDLNDHLAMNILILVSKLVKDKNSEIQAEPINSTNIHYKSLNDLISQMKNVFFNYQSDGIFTKIYKFVFKRNEPKKNATIENILNPANFVSLLKMKFSSNNLPPKSFIDVLLEKGKLGHDVLNRISENVHLDCFTNEEQSKNREDVKQMKHQKAAKLKEDIMNHYKSMIANYSASNQLQQKGADSIDDISSVSASEPFAVDKEVCSICSTYKNNEIFSYPLYIYRTKFPFIIDKPPLFSIEEVEGTPIDDIKEDYHLNDNDNENNEQENDNDNDENAVDPNVIMAIISNSFPQLFETEGLNEEQREERKNTINMLFNAIMQRQLNDIKSRKQQKNFNKDFKKEQQEESELYEINKEKQKDKRFTAGANFIIQFGICQHSVHPNCVHDPIFPCPIDRSIKNGLLPSIDGIPKSIVFKDLKTFEVNKEENSLAENIIDSISSFIDNFSSFFYNNPSLNVFIELIKSISGLISTYEIRLRSLPDCLDSEKTKLLSRNLFLVAWYAYKIQGKPKISIPGNDEIDCESRMTVFQRFIKRLIEEDDIEKDESNLNQIISSIINEIKEDDLNRKEKEICLLLRRIVLSEHFLLNKSVYESNMNDIIDWDDILSPTNLSQRYDVKFTTIDDCFEFSPFIFQKLPKEFLRFSQKPFNLPVNKNKVISLFNILDYNFLINNYDEINCEIKIENNIDEEIKRNNKNLKSCDEKNVGFFFDAFYSCKHYPTVLLFIGNYASQLFVVDQDFFAGFNPFYLDKYGCADIGFKRGQPLFINDEKYERFIDIILSGDFANSLIPINRLKQD